MLDNLLLGQQLQMTVLILFAHVYQFASAASQHHVSRLPLGNLLIIGTDMPALGCCLKAEEHSAQDGSKEIGALQQGSTSMRVITILLCPACVHARMVPNPMPGVFTAHLDKMRSTAEPPRASTGVAGPSRG